MARSSASGQELEVAVADGGSVHAELFLPGGGAGAGGAGDRSGSGSGSGSLPGVVVLHESFGLNDDVRRIAARFADAGYGAIAPSLYSHGRRIVCLSRVMLDMVRGTFAREVADVCAVRDALAAREEIDATRIAVAGFCQGGGFALIAGSEGGFSAAAVNYGDVPESRAKLDGLCPVVASYGGRDRMFGRDMAARLDGHLQALGVPGDVKVYDGAGHSFFNQHEGWQGWLARLPTPMSVGYDEAAAEDGWRRMLAFFSEHV
ncbi:MAG TPA: dienelactone hydrolase family protein [Solirubrobacteraceae bacterium]|jgi:carboxymethylenebutenolidase